MCALHYVKRSFRRNERNKERLTFSRHRSSLSRAARLHRIPRDSAKSSVGITTQLCAGLFCATLLSSSLSLSLSRCVGPRESLVYYVPTLHRSDCYPAGVRGPHRMTHLAQVVSPGAAVKMFPNDGVS